MAQQHALRARVAAARAQAVLNSAHQAQQQSSAAPQQLDGMLSRFLMAFRTVITIANMQNIANKPASSEAPESSWRGG